MSIWSRLFGRGRSYSSWDYPAPPVDTLVQDPRLSSTRLGAGPFITPWSASRLIGIFKAFDSNPTHAGLTEARLARQCLSQFWLTAPVDQLEVLYRSPIGECYRVLLAGRLAREPLLAEEQDWKGVLSQRLMTSFDRPETTNVLLAAMPYFAPGKMKVADPLSQVPSWLQEDYARLFDPQLLQQVWRPAALLGPADQASACRATWLARPLRLPSLEQWGGVRPVQSSRSWPRSGGTRPWPRFRLRTFRAG
jgi:hypothetical protein